MQVTYKTVEKDCRWALVNSRTLAVISPWIQGSAAALEFAHKHYRGWDLEKYLEVTDIESYKRLVFQKDGIPRMAEDAAKKRKTAKSFDDLIEFKPFRAELKRGTGEKQIW
jgi:hypothetical protein